jgi:GT2 family glycosyltransferase
MPDLWTIVLNYNGLEDTCRCLTSLQTVADPRMATLVVDNASTPDPTPLLRAEFPWAEVVRNTVNGGYAGGNNAGIRLALQRGAAYVVLLNNDTIVAPDFARRLLAAAEAHPEYDIFGPVINFLDEPDTVMTDGVVFNPAETAEFFQRRAVPLVRADLPALTEVDIVNGCCLLVAARVFRRIGLIDERFFLVHEESDFCLRARRAGFRCGVLGETLVWHKGSSSFARTGKRLQRYYDARNLWLLLHKHGSPRPQRCGPWESRLKYLKYLYWRYCIEAEEGHPEAANAVLEGLCDALSGRYGAYRPAERPAVPLLRRLFDFRRKWAVHKSDAQAKESFTCASDLCTGSPATHFSAP